MKPDIKLKISNMQAKYRAMQRLMEEMDKHGTMSEEFEANGVEWRKLRDELLVEFASTKSIYLLQELLRGYREQEGK